MVTKIIYGNPVETGAVIGNIGNSSTNPNFGKVESSWPFEWKYQLGKDDLVFGLGESMRGMNKRGWHYTSWCSDNPHHEETTTSLYGAHNFILVFGEKTFAMFFDTASRINFDIGYTNQNEMIVTTEDTGVVLYEITAESHSGESALTNIVHQFRELIGQSYVAPRWAFGFQQSRWGYRNEEDVRKVVSSYKENNLPLDAVCMDIDYMDEFMDFTVDSKKFPNLKKLSTELKEQGVRLIPIIDAGVKVKEGYSVYDEGVANNYFCKKEDGKSDYTAGVWPGRSHFPDFFNPKVREWFGKKYEVLTNEGIDGFWNDMNEPAMFYSDESLAEVTEKLRNTDTTNLDIGSFFNFAGLSGSTANNMEDYRRFYHNVTLESGETKRYRHDTVHNMFGGLMTRSAGEGLRKLYPEERKLIYSRASMIGAHRYGGIWTGDCNSWWSHLEQEIKQLPALNMCGFLYTGADIGGFGCDTTRDLVLRWLSLGAFTPLMRNHAASGTRPQECYAFGDTADFKNILDLRYALIPYLYSEYMKAVLTSTMYFKPLAFDYPQDKMALQTEDQLLLGNELMIAPVYKQNVGGRYVYIPEDMIQVTWKNSTATQKEITKGIHWVEMGLDEVVFFVRKNKMIPLYKPCEHTKDLNISAFTPLGNGETYDLYNDDGLTTRHSMEKYITTLNR